MAPGIVRFLIVGLMLAVAGCKGTGLSQMDTQGPAPLPGLNHLDTYTPEDAKEKSWWDSFRGNKGGQSSSCGYWGGECQKGTEGFWGNSHGTGW